MNKSIKNIILAITTGWVSGLSFYPGPFFFIIWFFFIPLYYLIFTTNNRAYLYSFLAGFTFYLTVMFWLGYVTRLGLILLCIYLGLYWVIFSYLARGVISKGRSLFWLPGIWVSLEFIREKIPHLGLSWAVLGYSQYKMLSIIQIADILGVKAISFLIMTVNIAIFKIGMKKLDKKLSERFLSSKGIMNLMNYLYPLLLLIFSFSYSLYKINKYQPDNYFTVTVIQPNIPQVLKWKEEARPFIISRLTALIEDTEPHYLVIFPEAAWPGLVDEEERAKLITWVRKRRRDILMGAVTQEGDRFYNSAILINRKGRIIDTYHKIKLVPFGEYVPLRKWLSFIEVINEFGDMSKGETLKRFSYGYRKFGVIICFEDSFSDFVADFASENDFLVNITNDAWFKGEPEATQHLGIMVFRAIENRIAIVRVANTGISGYVSSLGDTYLVKKGEVFVEAEETFHIPLSLKRSIYNKVGDLFSWVSFFLSIIIVGLPKRKKKSV